MRDLTVIPPSIQSAPLLGDWIRIGEDGSFDVRSGKVELGQGISAALGNAVAHALGVWARHLPLSPERLLRLVHAGTDGAAA